MLKQWLVNAIGKHNYLSYVKPVSDLYRSACVPIKGDGLKVIKHHLIPVGGTVLDIGANIGRFSAFAAPIVGRKGRVYGFEPVPSAALTFKRMVALRRFEHVHVVDVALSCRSGMAPIKIPLKDGWKPQVTIAHLDGIARADTCTVPVQVLTLDRFCKDTGIERVDFIKCDTEGHEYFVFLGGIETLTKYKPDIFCEVDQSYLERSNVPPSAVFDLLERLGYQGYLPTPQGDLDPVAGYQTEADYLFLHPATLSERLALRTAETDGRRCRLHFPLIPSFSRRR